MTDAASTVTVYHDLFYRQVPGFRPLSLDLYVPHAGARAVCLYLHGGGWRVGTRRAGPGPLSPNSSSRFVRMASAGLAVASAEYRLSGEARFPAQVQDVLAACQWLLTDCPEVAGLPLVIFGVSAGGTLAALAALDGSVPVQAAAAWYPPTDLRAMPEDLCVDPADATTREALLLGAPASAMPDLAADASPAAQVRAGAPPFLLMHGDADNLVPFRQSARLHDALIAADSSCILVSVPGYGHMFADMPDAELNVLIDRTVGFLLYPTP
jgi:acetyl esterase/lipase